MSQYFNELPSRGLNFRISPEYLGVGKATADTVYGYRPDTQAPKGYYQAGTIQRSNASGYAMNLPIFKRLTPVKQPQAAPAPVAEPKPDFTPPDTPDAPTNPYQSQIDDLEQSLADSQQALTDTTIDFERIIDDLKIDSAQQITDLNNQMDLTISGMTDEFNTQLANQQRGFDVSMANQAIAGRTPNLQIGTSSGAAQGGTSGFRRRASQFNYPIYQGLAINSGNINI